jgi:hypothetical protein
VIEVAGILFSSFINFSSDDIPIGEITMTQDRRTFLEALMSASLATGIVSNTGLTAGQFELKLRSALEPSPADNDPLTQVNEPHDAQRFWQSFYDSIDPKKGGQKPSLEAEDRKVQYLHHGPAGFRYVNDIKVDELLDYDGDVLVTASLGQYRPGEADHELLGDVKTSQLRIDFVQTKSFLDILAPMAWAALAIFFHDKASRLPTVDALGYKKAGAMNGIERVLLPKGSGRFAVNLSTVKPESSWHKILKQVIPALTAAAPILNLPAISIPVMKTFSEIFLGPDTDRRTRFLLNSLPAQWIATQQAQSDPDLGIENLPLLSGNYVMLPASQAGELGKQLPNLDWQSGFLVRKDASPTESPSERVERAVEGVTYVSMRLTVTKVPPSSAGAKSTAADDGDQKPETQAKPKTQNSQTKPTAPPPGKPTKKPTP